MFKNLVAVSLFAVVSLGCAHGQRAYVDPPAGMNPEPAALWTRPQEVGYTLGERIQGEAAQNCILMFICWGNEGGSAIDSLGAIAGIFTGRSTAVSDPLVSAAAAGAVMSAPTETDGILVLNHETDSFNIFLFSRRSARVIGKAVRFHPIGEVSQERADKVRALKAASGAIQIQGGSLGL